MAQLLVCEIVAPDRMLFSGEAEFVSAPAAEGEIGLMYLCSPIMSTLNRGQVRIKATMTSEPRCFAVNGGYLEVDGYKVMVLANHAIDLAEVDVSVAKERIASNEKRLLELAEHDSRAVFVRQEIEWQQYLIELKERKG